MSPRKRGWSDITVTDQFCGAGGSSIGAHSQGLRIRMAMNHWKLAVETHNTNFPDTDHDTCDISAADPRRYPSTDILITSPECTTHSPAGGNRRSTPQRDLFTPAGVEDPATTRSRATMRDVPRFTEYHEYRRIIVENVTEVTRWGPGNDGSLFRHWLQEMEILGYCWQLVSLNSMHCWPTPQSRDRLYICFWKKGDPKPDMQITPAARCHRCEKEVSAVQTWKAGALKRAMAGQPFGKYGRQYVYSCPICRSEVTPYYYAALNALDFSVPSQRIGDRDKPLKPRTAARVEYGAGKYGDQVLFVQTNQVSGKECRVRSGFDPGFTHCASNIHGMAGPAFLLDAAYLSSNGQGVRSLDREMMTLTARQSAALVSLPFLMTAGSNAAMCGATDPSPTHTGTERFAAVIPPAALIKLRGGEQSHLKNAKGLDSPIDTLSSGGNHYLLVSGAAVMRMQGDLRVESLDRPVGSQVASASVDALIYPSFLTSYYGTAKASGVNEPVDTITGVDRHALVTRGKKIKIEDWHFRMLQPHEIGRAMAFPTSYEVLGNKRDRVKQYGNAVTPPAMAILIERQVQAMTGDRAA